MANRFSIDTVFRGVDQMTAPINRIERRVNKMTRAMDRRFQKLNSTVDAFGSNARSAGVAVAASAAIIGASLGGVVATGAQFEQTLTNAAAKFPGEIRKGTDAFKQLEDAARRTGATTEFTASESAGALNFLAMAGFSAEASVAALPGVVDLATAAQVDLAEATDIASDALGAFGLATKDAAQLGTNLARINDVIARTTTTANTNTELFFEAMKDGAPVATAAGASIETFAATVGVLANAGIKGSKAGTTLKNMFLQLSGPTAGASKLLDSLGVKTQDSAGNLRDIFDILEDVERGMQGMGTAQKSAALDLIFGKRAIAGVNVLLSEGADGLRAYRSQIEAAGGASAAMAATMRDTVSGSLKTLNSAVESVSISIFSMNDGGIKNAIDLTTAWVRSNEELIASGIGDFMALIIDNLDTIVRTGKQIAGLTLLFIAFSAAVKIGGVALAVFKGLVIATSLAYGLFTKAVALAKSVMFIFNLIAMASPIGLIVVAVGVLIGLAAVLLSQWEPVRTFFGGLADTVSGVFDKVGTFGRVFGFTDGDSETAQQPQDGGAAAISAPQVVSPQAVIARSIEERRDVSSGELTIRSEAGTPELTRGTLPSGVKVMTSGGN